MHKPFTTTALLITLAASPAQATGSWYDVWEASFKSHRQLFEQRLERVNRDINTIPYVAEAAQDWKTLDRLRAEGGDCEDFAIGKMTVLFSEGVPYPDMELVLVTSKKTGEEHAVLRVTYGQSYYILDQIHDALLTPDDFQFYYTETLAVGGK